MVRLAADRVTVERLAVNLTGVKFRGAGLTIDEPSVKAEGDLTLVRETGTATVSKLTITSVPLSVTGGTLSVEPQAGGEVVVSGNGQCVSDLNRAGAVVRLYVDPRGPDALHGRCVGPVRFRYAGDVTTFRGTLDVTNFAYGPKGQPAWAEPKLRLEADGSYTDSTDAVAFAVAKVDRPGLALEGKGGIASVTTTQDVNLTGTLRFEWDKLTPIVREIVGGNFNATGTGSRAFAVNGRLGTPGTSVASAPQQPKPGGPIVLKAPVASAPKTPAGPSLFAAVSGEAAVGWNSVSFYGFDVGAGDVQAKMAKGMVTVTPLTATFGGGKVTLAPTLKLDTTP